MRSITQEQTPRLLYVPHPPKACVLYRCSPRGTLLHVYVNLLFIQHSLLVVIFLTYNLESTFCLPGKLTKIIHEIKIVDITQLISIISL